MKKLLVRFQGVVYTDGSGKIKAMRGPMKAAGSKDVVASKVFLAEDFKGKNGSREEEIFELGANEAMVAPLDISFSRCAAERVTTERDWLENSTEESVMLCQDRLKKMASTQFSS